jgi:hypothetical protein
MGPWRLGHEGDGLGGVVGMRELGTGHQNKGALPVVDGSSRGLVRCLEAIDRPFVCT